jgi:hypothetical protein
MQLAVQRAAKVSSTVRFQSTRRPCGTAELPSGSTSSPCAEVPRCPTKDSASTSGGSPVTYYLITALDRGVRRQHEKELFHYYLAALAGQGVERVPDFEEAWHDCRLASIWGLVIGWLITPPVNYGVPITAANIQRTTDAIIDAFAALGMKPSRRAGCA